jgi:hypothetical protein
MTRPRGARRGHTQEREVKKPMQKNKKRRNRWLPLVLERRTEFRDGREWSVELLAPVTAAHALADLVHRHDLAQASEALNRWAATR